MKETVFQNEIWNLENVLRKFIITDDVIPAIIKAVFSKYTVDKYLYAETKEEMMLYADAQKAIIVEDTFTYINMMQPIYDMIDRKIGTNGLLSSIPHTMLNDIYGDYNKKRKYSSDEASKSFIRELGKIDCTSEGSDKLFDILLGLIHSYSEKYGRISLENTTSKSINTLVSKLLDVGKDDTFMDFACGYGLSTFEIIKNGFKEIYLSDIDDKKIQIAVMLSIIKNMPMYMCSFEASNILDKNLNNILASKIFVDFPLSTKVDRDRYGSSNGSLLAINKVVENLSNNGKAVVTCASGILFSETKDLLEFRKELASKNLIEAIITLPPVTPGTTVNINLLSLSKAKKDTDVVVVDATDNKEFRFSNNARSNTELTTEGINKIVEIINNKESIIGISKVISTKDLYDKKSFVPAYYIEAPKTKPIMSYAEINNRLNSLYNRLNDKQ